MKRFEIKCDKTDDKYTYISGVLRLSVLSERILRIERAPRGSFEDRPSQSVICRNFAKPAFNVKETKNKITVTTKSAVFEVDKRNLKTVCVLDGKRVLPNKRDNLGGTARTLDMTSGYIKLGQGIMSRSGAAVFDDSRSFLLEKDGTLKARNKGSKDIYVFAFGDDYEGGLAEFYSLAGRTPLLPKYALGNWWSRYHAYSADEYIGLMDQFAAKDIPLSVATIDMDWHLVKDIPKDVPRHANPFQSRGWTGYTFNKKLFPDHKVFFAELKKRGLAVTMNLHPRDGVRYFEEQYPAMSEANGIDPAGRKPVEFDLTDPKFVESYFDILHHPYEDEGVDFWWIDWQQGKKSKLAGLDPLWLLNHYHTLDAGRKGRTPLILSRYAGIGSHRYPIGFSGDTTICWASLKFQPYFTSTAANVGYTWWSHDIGGHVFGRGNGELYLRWLQFGVFSPINRLHSSNNAISKEPWLYGEKIENYAIDFLRLRHRLLPYLYTANVLTSKRGLPLVEPMYYRYKDEEAYRCPDQYCFGSELIVAPVLSKAGKNGKSRVRLWLPDGIWTDFFTGEKQEGKGWHTVERDLDSIPVFAKEGAIIPLLANRSGNSREFDELEVRVYPGCGAYTLYDEAGSIKFSVSKSDDGKIVFCIKPADNAATKRIKVVFMAGKYTDITTDWSLDSGDGFVTVPCVDTRITAKYA